MSKNTFRLFFTLLTLLILFNSIYNIYEVSLKMSDENLYANQGENVVIISVDPGGVSDNAGLRVGDYLKKINGVTIESAMQAQSFLDRAQAGESLVYTIERDGQTIELTVNLALAGLRIWHLGALCAGILFLIFGIFLAISRSDHSHARIMSIAAVLMAQLLINITVAGYIMFQSVSYFIVVYLLIVGVFFAIALSAHASLYFPERKYEKISRFWMIHAHYILAVSLTLVTAYLYGIKNQVQIYYVVIALLYALIIEIIYWRKRRPEYKARSRIFKIVLAFLFLTGIALAYLSSFTPYAEYLAFSLVLLPLSHIITTIRYRVYDIHLRFRLSLVYSLLQFSVLIAFIASIVLIIRFLPLWHLDLPAVFLSGSFIEFRSMQQLPPDLQLQVQTGYLIFVGIVLAFSALMIKTRTQRLLDRMFFQQKYDYRYAMKNFVHMLSATFSREEISRQSVAQIYQIMKLKGTMIALSDNGHFRINNAAGNMFTWNDTYFELPEQIKILNTQKENLLKPDEITGIKNFANQPDKILCGMPIVSAKNDIEAILFTGEKLSESPYNNEDVELLKLFAEHLRTAFERARFYQEAAENERLKRELEIAREIQLNSLPKFEPEYPGLEICSTLSPATEVGGDYYDYLEYDHNRLGIIIGDVLGKGASAAFHMSKIQGFIRTLSREFNSPKNLLHHLNNLILENFNPDFFFTALFGLFNTREKSLELYRLGHNGLFYFHAAKGLINLLEPSGIGLGMAEASKFDSSLQAEKITYQKGDIFAFITDGFLEAMNSKREIFGEENISRIILTHAAKSASDIMEVLKTEVEQYSGGEKYDDTTGIIIKIND